MYVEKNNNTPIYKRVVLKLSGEALAGKKGHGFDYCILNQIADEVIEINNLGVQVAIVVGGGNIGEGAVAWEWIEAQPITWGVGYQ